MGLWLACLVLLLSVGLLAGCFVGLFICKAERAMGNFDWCLWWSCVVLLVVVVWLSSWHVWVLAG